MHWIFLSPHFDDAVFSCGGLMWDLVQRGDDVLVWTICAGEPPKIPLSDFARSLHDRWKVGKSPVQARLNEDIHATRLLGVGYRYSSFTDCIYRTSQTGEALYADESSLFGTVHPGDQGMVYRVSADIQEVLGTGIQVVAPLAAGNHVDHQIIRQAAESATRSLAYYADIPYVLKEMQWQDEIPQDLQRRNFPVSAQGFEKWFQSIQAYTSQISSFWQDPLTLRSEIGDFDRKFQGIPLWFRE